MIIPKNNGHINLTWEFFFLPNLKSQGYAQVLIMSYEYLHVNGINSESYSPSDSQ